MNQQNQPNADPLMYASALNNLMIERNPIQTIVGDLHHMFKVITNLGKTRKMAQMRIEQLEQQLTTVQQQMATVHPQIGGQRFNKLR